MYLTQLLGLKYISNFIIIFFLTFTQWNTIQEKEKKELLPLWTAWMELESIMLSEINQEVKDKYRVISPISGT